MDSRHRLDGLTGRWGKLPPYIDGNQRGCTTGNRRVVYTVWEYRDDATDQEIFSRLGISTDPNVSRNTPNAKKSTLLYIRTTHTYDPVGRLIKTNDEEITQDDYKEAIAPKKPASRSQY